MFLLQYPDFFLSHICKNKNSILTVITHSEAMTYRQMSDCSSYSVPVTTDSRWKVISVYAINGSVFVTFSVIN
jgi:hypothetical protein